MTEQATMEKSPLSHFRFNVSLSLLEECPTPDNMTFVFFFLLFWWFMLIFYKVNAPVKIYNRFQYKFIDDLTNCEFCQESHIGTIFALLLFLYCGDYFVFNLWIYVGITIKYS